MQSTGVSFTERDFEKEPLSEAELRELIGERSPLEFLSPRSEVYRERSLKENPPSPEEAVQLLAEHPTLLRRPLLLVPDGEPLFGFNETAYTELARRIRG